MFRTTPLLELPGLVADLGYEYIELSPREDFMTFFRCDANHHSIAFLGARDGQPGFNHAAFEIRDWEEWINVVLGAWLLTSPFVLGISEPAAMADFLIVGVLVIALALYEIRSGRAEPT